MPEHKYPDLAWDDAASGRSAGKKSTSEPEDLQIAEDLYENGAYTNGMLGF